MVSDQWDQVMSQRLVKNQRYFYQNHHDTCFELHGHFELHEKKCRLAVE